MLGADGEISQNLFGPASDQIAPRGMDRSKFASGTYCKGRQLGLTESRRGILVFCREEPGRLNDNKHVNCFLRASISAQSSYLLSLTRPHSRNLQLCGVRVFSRIGSARRGKEDV